MRRAERIVLTLAALGKAAETAALSQGTDTIAPPGQNLVWIGLMADIEDQFVVRGVKHVMDRSGQFHDAQTRAQMPAGATHSADHFIAQFVGQLS